MHQPGPTDTPYLSSFAYSSFRNSLIIAKTLKQFLPNPSMTQVKQATFAFLVSKITQASRITVLDPISANTTVVKIIRSQLAALRPLKTSSLSSNHNTLQWIIAPECLLNQLGLTFIILRPHLRNRGYPQAVGGAWRAERYPGSNHQPVASGGDTPVYGSATGQIHHVGKAGGVHAVHTTQSPSYR